MSALFHVNPFLVNLVLIIFYSSFLVALVGSVMQMGRLSAMAGSISHTILAGVGLATWLGFSLWLGSIGVAIIACLILSYVSIYHSPQLEVTHNILWGGGMALGILFTSFSQGYQQNLSNFLFGNIVLVSSGDGRVILAMSLCILTLLITFYRQFLLLWFSPIFSQVQQLNRFLLWFLSLFIISLGVISLVKTMGIALALVLLSVPNHIARLFTSSWLGVLCMSYVLAFLAMLIGLLFSYYIGTPAGASIALVCLSFYIIPFMRRLKRSKL